MARAPVLFFLSLLLPPSSASSSSSSFSRMQSHLYSFRVLFIQRPVISGHARVDARDNNNGGLTWTMVPDAIDLRGDNSTGDSRNKRAAGSNKLSKRCGRMKDNNFWIMAILSSMISLFILLISTLFRWIEFKSSDLYEALKIQMD